ncbi:hypothetical protein [Sphingopyxis yananensis]|uniref:hypothetical protein n=1 Tax=Sphingopyxis yananensis TaxID=2886687 RepID=UPI001D12BE06|nr:hypothetical protein [Sphingopyxis yananensis]MCC2602229.1 hypothetical protein [Sphingopyxis yananensis]
MRSETNEAAHAAPLLFRHATPRTSSADLPGYYDPSTQLWVIETSAGIVPVVQAAASTLIETNTSTRVRQEAEDQDYSGMVGLAAIAFAETTLTAVKMEVDDQDASTDLRSFDALLDTSTLTKVRQESADDDLTRDETLAPRRRLGTLAELATKTDVQQESDDQMSTGAMLELETRSFNNQEGVDDDFPAMLLELQTKTFANVEGDDDDLSMIN